MECISSEAKPMNMRGTCKTCGRVFMAYNSELEHVIIQKDRDIITINDFLSVKKCPFCSTTIYFDDVKKE